MKMQGQERFFVIIIFLVVVSIFHSGEALKCYDCESISSPTCVKEPTSVKVRICPTDDMLCMKYTYDMDGEKITARNCGIQQACKWVEALFRSKDCYECSTDLCNASATNAISTIVMITSGLITLLWIIQ